MDSPVGIAIWLAPVIDGTPVSKMASLVDSYEQQYAVLTADITAKIGRIRIQSGGKEHRRDDGRRDGRCVPHEKPARDRRVRLALKSDNRYK